MADNTILPSTGRPQRIVFIDVVRAYAILMMLQGHFVDTLLAPDFRDPNNPIYATWFFFRGLTAPVFFFSTGLVFIYLLLKDGKPLLENKRVKKGIRRGFFLVAVGYVLKFHLPSLLIGRTYPSFFVIDVLHCIGIGILGLILAYSLYRISRIPFPLLLLIFGLAAFLGGPLIEYMDWSNTPNVFANYFTIANGSVFTPLPWIGYTFFGGILGTVVHKRPNFAFTNWFPLVIASAGFLISIFTYQGLVVYYQWLGKADTPLLYETNTFFWRLGHVMMEVSLFMWILHFFEKVPRLLTKIGSETLTIYGVHYVILYGTWFGLGLSQLYYRSLNPAQTVIGAALFVTVFVFLIKYIEPIRQVIYEYIPSRIQYLVRVGKVVMLRNVSRKVYAKQPKLGISILKYFL